MKNSIIAREQFAAYDAISTCELLRCKGNFSVMKFQLIKHVVCRIWGIFSSRDLHSG